MLLNFAGVDVLALWIQPGGGQIGALVHVGEEDGGANSGSGVQAGTTIAMAASADLEVERAIDTVLLGSEDGSQMLSHGGRQ